MSNLRSDAAAAGNPTPFSTPADGIKPDSATAAPRSGDQQKSGSGDNLYRTLPIDDPKKNPPSGGHDLRSEFHVGPAMMPGPFMSSMGTNATAFERDQHKDATKAKKD
ncbi:hypothetical protein DFQ27_006863 [Actinomortierella ambigua]|uniref:Uncharacterized protein n=1 Tax=Actinomortierella ambigua TaxID=1343610 RepID=A0A9P6UAW4_9FUNG|nr:hypothetical protein DFQ26_000588 [Actinomortierella ambigua]KAG0268371.1 hypothetical protein DFQ27_006863 [Actinomortierella ambigua]